MRRSLVLLNLFVLVLISGIAVSVFAANSVSSVSVANQNVKLTASGGVEQVRYFTLDSPMRLVVDLYGVQPGEHGRNFSLTSGFRSLRVGPYEDKTRFVFDVSGSVFPTFNVNTENEQVIVTWQDTLVANKQAAKEVPTVGSAQISAIDFTSEAGKSRVNILVRGTSEVTGPEKEGNKVQFSLNNATIPRSLRREFDTLSFPSAIHSVTPYMVNVGGVPQVRFAVTLKGNVAYELKKTNEGYAFIVNDGNYAQSMPPVTGMLPVAVSDGMVVDADGGAIQTETVVGAVTMPVTVTTQTGITTVADQKQYSGEKTSLVFDNADVRDILRLIAEMNDLNLIASDDVKGTVTLRLIDVPWDQALDLVLDITGLGMLKEGNVVRVLPINKIRSMREAELTAVRSQEKLEPLVTEVISVNYADLDSVLGPVKSTLSDRGSVTPDNRNKLLIINDVVARIEQTKELIKILDTPERQVMIEARIVEVNTDYSRDLGINWGISHNNDPGGTDANKQIDLGFGGDFLLGTALGTSGLGAGFTWGNSELNETVLDLRISALEATNNLKIISTPRVTTLNGQEATISQGTDFPYQTVEDGEVKVEFKQAVLELKVTPVINPDGSVIMTIMAKNDNIIPDSGGALTTKNAETMVLVEDGETTVLGGIFIEREGLAEEGVPFLMDLPYLGQMFKSTRKENSKDELLIFITPRIVSNN